MWGMVRTSLGWSGNVVLSLGGGASGACRGPFRAFPFLREDRLVLQVILPRGVVCTC